MRARLQICHDAFRPVSRAAQLSRLLQVHFVHDLNVCARSTLPCAETTLFMVKGKLVVRQLECGTSMAVHNFAVAVQVS